MRAAQEPQFCLSVREFMAGAKKIDDRFTSLEESNAILAADLLAERARRAKRFGMAVGCGPGVGVAMDGSATQFDFVVSCNWIWGFRIGGLR
jgi:hypothetical protein